MVDEKNLSCPCMPQCPNYGKCRVCIASHAEYYTMPHCIKTMLEDMKKNHKHPVNPHMKKSLPERISEFYEKNPHEHLRTVAENLKITEHQLLEAHPNAVSVPLSDFDSAYEKLAELEKVLLHVDSGSVLIQVETALPKMMKMKSTVIVKNESDGMNLTSLLFTDNFYSMFLVRESLYGKESMSLAIVGEDEKIALSVYMRRDEDGKIEEKSRAVFEELWQKYNSDNNI